MDAILLLRFRAKDIISIVFCERYMKGYRPQTRGGVLPEKSGGGVRPASQNPYPIYDQNLRYSPPY